MENDILQRIYSFIQKMTLFTNFNLTHPFTDTEFRLLREVLIASQENRKVISSELAKSLGLTRSAISQVITKLIKCNIIQRTPSKSNRKIAYIELTDKSLQYCKNIKAEVDKRINHFIQRLGQDNVSKFLNFADVFVSVFEEEFTEPVCNLSVV